MNARNRPAAQLLCAIAILGTGTVVTACGDSSSKQPASRPAADATTTATRATATEAAATEFAKAHRDLVTHGVVTHRPLHGTGGIASNDDNPGRADVGHNPPAGENDPCKLVSRTEAQAIVGRPVAAPQEAPLGPTCIYQPVGAKTFVTLAVEGVKLAQIKLRIHHLTQFELGGRTGYCGVYGESTTFVPLANGGVLDITAPCNIGKLFARKALLRLGVR
jgi:hypothetical protein